MMNKRVSFFGNKICTALVVVAFCGIGCLAASDEDYSPMFQTFSEENSLGQVTSSRQGSIRLDAKHVLWGGRALRWEWQAGDVLEFEHPFQLRWDVLPDGVVYAPAFALNVYCEKTAAYKLTVEAGEASFTFGLNFTGWRSAQVRWFGDMMGTPTEAGDGFRIIAPASGSGVVWLDGIIPDSLVYEAIPQADWQVPYVSDGEDEHRKEGALRAHLITMTLEPEITPATAEERAGLHLVEERLEEDILTKKTKPEEWCWKQYEQILRGAPIRTSRQVGFSDPLPTTVRPRLAYDVMENFAILYRKTGKQKYRDAFLELLHHVRDQGWVAGSVLGSLHLTGYDGARPRGQACFLMRNVLEEEGLRDAVAQDVQWLNNARECLILPPCDGNLDYMHTFMIPQLLALLTTADEVERVAWLRAYHKYVEQVIGMNTNDERDGFKRDGTAFHHYGHYPLYAAGAVTHVGELKHLLDGTPFALSQGVLDHVRHSLETMQVSMMGKELPLSMGGRHPFKAGHWTKTLHKAAEDLECAPVPEKIFLPMNNAAAAVHRRNDWFAVMRGLSQYVWASEMFPGAANRYGVFMNHGSLELLSDYGLAANGYEQAGWDWRMFPGATTALVPYSILKDFELRHYKSRETFAGAMSLDGLNGHFVLDMGNDFFELYARKSVFCFGDVIVCLGDAIRCARQNYETVTTLFQNSVKREVDSKAERIGSLHCIRDDCGNSYLLSDVKNLKVHVGTQHSFDHYKATPTQGTFYTTWLDHGRRPTDESYTYTILVQMDEDAVREFAGEPSVVVLEQTRLAHIVKDDTTGITAFNLFEAGAVNHELLKSVSKPCMVEIRESDTGLDVAVCDPDLQWRRERFDELRIVLAGEWGVPEADGLVLVHAENGQTSIVLQPKYAEPVVLEDLVLINK